MFLFTQERGGEEKWKLHLASERKNLVDSGKYAFITALDVSNDFSQDPDAAARSAMKYNAPYVLVS